MARSARAPTKAKKPEDEKLPRIVDTQREKRDWRDPDDTNPLRRQAKMVQGIRRVDSLALLLQRGSITRKHAAAGVKLRDDRERGELGARPGSSERPEVRGTGGIAGPAEAQLDALARYRAAMGALGGGLGRIVVHVVLDGGSLTDWADRHSTQERKLSVHQATGYFVAAMDVLVEHYGTTITLDDLFNAEEI